jgi:lantibiotic modifying enzyme
MDKNKSKTNSRLGWCYGDLGIALTFWQVGKLLDYPKFKTEALEIMRHACNRKDLQKNAVNDCGLCHGSAGIAHIFRRFYWESNDASFKTAADYWTQVTLDMATHEDGLAGYCAFRATEEKKWITEYGLLEGIGGIGLALLGAIQSEVSDWDKSLMMSSN